MNPSSLPAPGPSRWEKLGQHPQLHTRIFDVLGVRYRHPVRGTEKDFIVVQAPDWVNVVALTPERRSAPLPRRSWRMRQWPESPRTNSVRLWKTWF